MRESIETAPTDGSLVVLEDDASATFEVARWSNEAGGWVGEKDTPSRIAPTYWHPLSPFHPLSQENNRSGSRKRRFGFSSLQRVMPGRSPGPGNGGNPSGSVANLSAPAEAKREPHDPRRFAVTSVTANLYRAMRVDLLLCDAIVPYATRLAHRIGAIGRKAIPTRPRFVAASIAATLFGVALVGFLFRGELVAYATRYTHEISGVGRNTVERIVSNGTTLLGLRWEDDASSLQDQEPVHRPVGSTLGMQEDLLAAGTVKGGLDLRRSSDEERGHAEDLANPTAKLRQALQEERARAEALSHELDSARREIEANAALLRKTVAEAAQVKQAAEIATAELRQSLQEERARTEALKLEMARHRMQANAGPQVSRVPMPLSRPLSSAGVSQQSGNAGPRVSRVPMPLSRPLSSAGVSQQSGNAGPRVSRVPRPRSSAGVSQRSGGGRQQARSAIPRSVQAARRSDRSVRKSQTAPNSAADTSVSRPPSASTTY